MLKQRVCGTNSVLLFWFGGFPRLFLFKGKFSHRLSPDTLSMMRTQGLNVNEMQHSLLASSRRIYLFIFYKLSLLFLS